MQIVIVNQLPKEENYWLQSLRNNLKSGEEIRELVKNYEKKKKSGLHQAVMDLIVRANWEKMEEEKKMCEALMELFSEELKESENRGIEAGIQRGIETGIQRGIETGIQRGIQTGIRNLIETCYEIGLPEGKTRSKLMEKYELPEETAEAYMEKYWNK